MASESTLKKMAQSALLTRAAKYGYDVDESEFDRMKVVNFIMKIEAPKIEAVEPAPLTEFQKLRQKIAAANIQHQEVQMPVNAMLTSETENEGNELMMQFASGQKFVANRIGLQYMAYRLKLGDDKVSQYLRGKITGAELTDAFNIAWEAIPVSKRGKLIAASVNNKLVGMLRNYTAVAHNDLLNSIEGFGLAGSVVYGNVNDFEMNMIISVEAFKEFIAGLRITNGHSGHVSFRYTSAFRVNDFEFDLPMADRVRHLSSVITSVSNMKSLIEGAADLRINRMLEKTTIRQVGEIIRSEILKPSKRQQILLDNPVIGQDCENALDYVISLSRYTKTSGYKKAATSILNVLIEKIVSIT